MARSKGWLVLILLFMWGAMWATGLVSGYVLGASLVGVLCLLAGLVPFAWYVVLLVKKRQRQRRQDGLEARWLLTFPGDVTPHSRTYDCGHVLDSLALDVRKWMCPECGVWHDRDVSAAPPHESRWASGLCLWRQGRDPDGPVPSRHAPVKQEYLPGNGRNLIPFRRLRGCQILFA
jgi:hypothetical protein